MKYWEFLIQKEGDETWLPLETQQVEILEGRYRVVAHTDRKDVPVEIRVSQLITEEMPPRRRVRKRTGTISDAGLVVVMPFVHLKPGQWDLKCSGADAIGDVIDAQWEYSVELQVFAHTDEDWSAEWPVPEDDGSVATSLVENETAVDSLASLPLAQAQAELQENQQRQGTADDADAQPTDAVYSIYLKQQAFLARRNQPMTIMGQVQNRAGIPQGDTVSQLWLRLQNPKTAQVIMEAHRPLSLERLPADFKVKIQLPANVKTRVVLGEVSLRTASVDADESATNGSTKLLSSTAFTITAGIAQLLDELASRESGQFEEEVSELADSQAHALYQTGVSVDRQQSYREPDLVSPILDPTHKSVVPAVGVVLPPRLEREDGLESHSYAPGQPELPAFADGNGTPPLQVSDAPSRDGFESDNRLPDEPLPMVSQPAQFMGTSIEDDDLEASQIAALLDDIDGNLSSQSVTMDELESPGVEAALPESFATESFAAESFANDIGDDDDVVDQSVIADQSVVAEETAEPRLPIAEAANKPTAKPTIKETPADAFMTRAERERQQRSQRQAAASTAFKSLKLKDHFWQRLTNLTHKGRDEAAQLAQEMEAAGVSPNYKNSGSAQSWSSSLSPVAGDSALPANSEVVIYNRPMVDGNSASNASTPDAKTLNSVPTTVPTPPPATGSRPESTIDVMVNSQQIETTADSASQSSTAQSFPARSFPARSSMRQSQDVEGQTAGGRNTGLNRFAGPEADLPEMALPVISVPMGDLIAGGTVTITVRSQPSAYKPFIKLWMIDRQSRTLVGEPKLLTNLQPDALGYLETSTELQVPMGCLDVQIAAIAVDIATQQESNKAIVNRHVVPAGQFPSRQSPGSLRNFNL